MAERMYPYAQGNLAHEDTVGNAGTNIEAKGASAAAPKGPCDSCGKLRDMKSYTDSCYFLIANMRCACDGQQKGRDGNGLQCGGDGLVPGKAELESTSDHA